MTGIGHRFINAKQLLTNYQALIPDKNILQGNSSATVFTCDYGLELYKFII